MNSTRIIDDSKTTPLPFEQKKRSIGSSGSTTHIAKKLLFANNFSNQATLEINFKQLKRCDEIGVGSFGSVFTSEFNGEEVAVKEVNYATDTQKIAFLNEKA